MEENNILSKGVYMLYEIKDDLAKNNELRERAAVLADNEKRLSKRLDTAKKNLASEINGTISKRRGEIEASFNSQLNTNRTRLKKVQSRRASAKNSKISKRIEDETEDYREEIRSHKEEIRSIFSRNDIPGILNTSYCFAMFMPTNLGDYGIIGVTMLCILILPVIIYNLFLPDALAKPWSMVLMYLLFLGIFVGTYYLIRKNIYSVKKRELKEANRYRNKIADLKRRIAKKEQKIRKDADESGYELEKFDTEIDDIQRQIDQIVEEKKNALSLFENQTKRDISNDINGRFAPDIETDEKALESTREEKHSVDSELSELTVKISKNYEAYLGKEALSVSVIDSLIEIMNDGNAENIADALDYYKKTVDKSLQTLQ